MIGMRLSQVKKTFFDPNAVMSQAEKAEQKILSKFGAFVRQRARSSIRRRKRVSNPGQPPSNRSGFLKDNIFFVYDRANHSVLIGPILLNIVFLNGDGKPVTGVVPEVLERGGQIGIIEWFLPVAQKWVRADLRFRRNRQDWKRRRRTVTIAARPYMQPAFQKELPKAPALWTNSIRRAA